MVVIQGDEPTESIATSTSVATSANPAPIHAPITLTARVGHQRAGGANRNRDVLNRRCRPGARHAHRRHSHTDDLLARPREPSDHGVVHAGRHRVPRQRQLRRTAHSGDRAGAAGGHPLSPGTAVVGTNTPDISTVAGVDADGNALGDQTAGATFSISPNGTCTANSRRATTIGTKVVTANVGSLTATATLDVRRPARPSTFPTISAKTMVQSPLTVSATTWSVGTAGLLHEHHPSGVRRGRDQRLVDHAPRACRAHAPCAPTRPVTPTGPRRHR